MREFAGGGHEGFGYSLHFTSPLEELTLVVSRTFLHFSGVLHASLALSGAAAAQTAVIGGTVLRDSSGKTLADVEVAIPALRRGTRTNFTGEFRIDRLAAGTYIVMFRHLGFNVLTDTITVKDGQGVDDEFIMIEAPASLGAQQVTATSEHQPLYLEEFNDRMKVGLGHFLPESEVRKADSKSFINFIASSLPGMKIYHAPGGAQILQSGRKPCTGPAFQCTNSGKGELSGCTVSVYIDGVAEYVTGSSKRDPPDFSEMKSEDFSAVEFYASGATAPAKYNATGNDCGVLLLWRRYR